MSGDFEKKISQRMDGFQLTPKPQIWERVAAALPEKRRRRFAIWWLLPLAACLCGGLWLVIDKQKNSSEKRITGIARKTPAENSIPEKIVMTAPVDTAANYTFQQKDDREKDVISKKQNSVQQTVDISKEEIATNHQLPKSKPPVQPDNVNAPRRKDKTATENILPEDPGGTPDKQTEQLEDVAIKLNSAIGNAQLQKATNIDSIFLKENPILPPANLAVIPAPEIVVKDDTASSKNSDTLVRNSVEIKIHKPKRVNKNPEWSLMVAVGKSSLANKTSDLQKSFADANSYNYGGVTSGGQNRNLGSFSNPTGGINFSVGITRNQIISKHFTWEASVSYHLLTARQRTGSRNDSLSSLSSLTEQKDITFFVMNLRTSPPSAGSGSTTITWINQAQRVHRVQLGTGIGYTLNPSAHSPIRFSAGAFVAYNISNNILLHDYRINSYIRSAKLSNKLMFGGQAGVDVFINHKVKAGLLFQHDFTNVGKSKVGSVFRWNQLQFRVAIPLSKQ